MPTIEGDFNAASVEISEVLGEDEAAGDDSNNNTREQANGVIPE